MTVPTVDLGFRDVVRCSIEIAGESPSIESTSGFSICSRNCRAYADSDSTYRLCPSAKIVSNAREDLPDPLTPVMRELVAGDDDVDVFEVVLARTVDDQLFRGHDGEVYPFERMFSIGRPARDR